MIDSSALKSPYVAAVIGLFVLVTIGVVLVSMENDRTPLHPAPEQRMVEGIPIPFIATDARFGASLMLVGYHRTTQGLNIEVYGVELNDTNPPANQSQALGIDKIYLVHTNANTSNPQSVPVDLVMSKVNSLNANYFGYEYSDENATVERQREGSGQPLSQRFPGVFFASDTARNDPASGIVEFEQVNSVSFRPTTNAANGARFLEDGKLYVFIVNEQAGSTVSLRAPVICGDGWRMGVELAPEKCDDGNVTSGDGCDSQCSTEQTHTCTGNPSVCTPIQPVGLECVEAGALLALPLNALVVDEGDANGYRETNGGGGWTTSILGVGYRGRERQGRSDIAPGSQAQWCISNLSAATYDVYATWGGSQTATNAAPFTVYVNDAQVGSATVNQTTGSSGFNFDGVQWQKIGTHVITGTVKVLLGKVGIGYVEADGILLVPQTGGGTSSSAGGGAVCGNNELETPEACEDGNTVSGDACSNICAIETGWSCSKQVVNDLCQTIFLDCGPNAQLETATGSRCNSFFCEGTLRRCVPIISSSASSAPAPVCGNGVEETGEQCDDGNTVSNDGCNNVCQDEFCGDAIIQTGIGEECDAGAQNGQPGSHCTAPNPNAVPPNPGCRIDEPIPFE